MIRNTLLSAWGSIKRKRLVSSLTILAIALGISLVALFAAFYDYYTGNVGPYKNRNRCLFMSKSVFSENGIPVTNRRARNYYATRSFINKHVKSLATPELVSIYSKNIGVNIGTRYVPNRIKYLETDENFWKIFDFEFIDGRPYGENEMNNGDQVCVISESLSNTMFGNNGAIGKFITKRGRKFKIIGLIKDTHPLFEVSAQMYVPCSQALATWNEDDGALDTNTGKTNYYSRGAYKAVVMCKQKSDIIEVKTEFGKKITKLNKKGKVEEFDTVEVSLLKASERIMERLAFVGLKHGYLIFVLIFLILISIPILNLININTYAFFTSCEEIGVQKAFGASRIKIMLQLLLRNLALTFLGGLIGFVLSIFLFELFSEIIFSGSNIDGYQISYRFIMYSLLGSIVFSFITGVVPAWRVTRLKTVTIFQSGKHSVIGKISFKRKKRWLQITNFTIVFMFFAFVGGLFFTYFLPNISSLGYANTKVLTIGLAHQGKFINDEHSGLMLIEDFGERVKRIEGVTEVSFSYPSMPLFMTLDKSYKFRSEIDSYNGAALEVDANFFNVLGLDLSNGAWPNDGKETGLAIPVVLSGQAEKKLFGNEASVGRQFVDDNNGIKYKVSGVVQHYRHSLNEKEEPIVFIYRKKASGYMLVSYSSDANMNLIYNEIEQLRDEILGSAYVFFENTLIESEINNTESRILPLIKGGLFLICFILINIFIGYSNISWFNVQVRKIEMGVRRAVGSNRLGIQTTLIWENIRIVLYACLIGSIILSQIQLMTSLVKWADWWMGIIWAGIITLMIMLISVWVPAFRAAKVHPVEALADE